MTGRIAFSRPWWRDAACEIAAAALTVAVALIAERLLTNAFFGTNYGGADGKMLQAMIYAAQHFTSPLSLTNLNPLEGDGSQLFPINVWLNPTYWPFAFFERQAATDLSALVTLGIFVLAVFVMARLFNVPRITSAICAQFSILLFAPALFLVRLATVFTLMPGNGVVYAPFMVAMGLLARVESGAWRRFALISAAICALLLYSVGCDPLWFSVSAWNWAVPYAVVVFGRFELKTILLRSAAMAISLVVFAVTGVAKYLLTIATYTARVQFPDFAAARVRGADYAGSILFYSPYMKYIYAFSAIGWIIGLLTLRDRQRLFVTSGAVGCGGVILYLAVYLLGSGTWALPLPVYAEHALTALFLASGVAGYAGAFRLAARKVRLEPAFALAGGLVAIAAAPTSAFLAVRQFAPTQADAFDEHWPNEPELNQFFAEQAGLYRGLPFRGSVIVATNTYAVTLRNDALWLHGVPTVAEYSQLVTPASSFFVHAVLRNPHPVINMFVPEHGTSSWEHYWATLQMLGTRYVVVNGEDTNIESAAEAAGLNKRVFPYRPHGGTSPPGIWNVVELPNPNIGNYSPTRLQHAESAADIAAMMAEETFAFTDEAVIASDVALPPLTPSHDMRLTWVRGGLHVSGRSDGTSLALLPLQFSHCLRTSDARVRLVRTDLMMTGLVFSGNLDTTITFGYGLFSPGCRSLDMSDLKTLNLTGTQPEPEEPTPEGGEIAATGVGAKLRAAAAALK